MPVPYVDDLPDAPLRSEQPATFTAKAEAWVAALTDWTTQVNALADYLAGLTGSSGPITDTDLTMATARLLGRTTAATGAVEEISVGSGLTLSGGELSADGGSSLPAGGATGTVLAKQSATDGDADWIDPGSNFLLENMNRPVGKAYTAKGEYQAIAAATETDILNVLGNNGFVNSIFIAIDDTDYQAREQTVLKVYVDGSGTPVVNCTLARFFAGDYNPPAFKTRFLGFDTATAGGGGQKRSYQCYFPMPFTTGMRITLTPPSGYAISYCWWQVGYNLGDSISWGRMKKFHAVETTNTSLAANSRHTMIDVSSVRGALLGCFLRIDGTSFTFLEGNVRVFVDGEGTAAYESSGMEDYFNHGFYFQSGVLTTDYHGLTKKDAAAFVIGAYRFHVLDPIQFETGLKMDFQNGDTSQQAYTGPSDVAACVWYYTDS